MWSFGKFFSLPWPFLTKSIVDVSRNAELNNMTKAQDPSGCPVDHSKYTANKRKENEKNNGGCPVPHEQVASLTLNPLNNMPELSQQMTEGQSLKLSTEREVSTIPKSALETQNKWEYPSSQVCNTAKLLALTLDFLSSPSTLAILQCAKKKGKRGSRRRY